MKNEQEIIDALISQRINTAANRYKQMDELEWLQYRRDKARRKLQQSRKRIISSYHELTQPQVPTSKWELFTFMLDRGVTIARGLRMGYKIGDAIHTIMGLRKSMKRR